MRLQQMASYPVPYQVEPLRTVRTERRSIALFPVEGQGGNVDARVVESFGEEWKKFHRFDPEEIRRLGAEYFDIVTEDMLRPDSYCLDVGCGSGRWTSYLLPRIGFMEAVDPSQAVFAADLLLGDAPNVRLTQASTDTLPFPDCTFDFAMSIGVLHHIPDTAKALSDCVRKVKIGGYFYVYLYYNLENRGVLFRTLFRLSDLLRRCISRLPSLPKKIVCDLIALLVYMPLVLLGRLFRSLGLKRLAKKMPLSSYQNYSFFVIRNDALDRFGTRLEQRFSRDQIRSMMQQAGLEQIVISEGVPYWHAVGKRQR